MKIFENFTLIGVVYLLIGACSSFPEGKKIDINDAKMIGNISGQEFTIDQENSTVKWIGAKPTGEHNGVVNIKEGKISIKERTVVGGIVVMNLNSIVCNDLEDDEMNAKLVGHLKSADFFDVEKYPVAKFEITSIEKVEKDAADLEMGQILVNSLVKGNLSMKDSVKSISFEAMIEINDDQVIAESNQFVIDRTEWGVNYGSKNIFNNLKDKFINDDMALSIKIIAKK